MLAMMETNQAALDRATRDSVDTLSGRIAEIGATIDRLASRLGDQQATSEALLGGLGDGIGHIETRLAALHSDGLARHQALAGRSEERSGGKECVSTCRSRGSAYHEQNKKHRYEVIAIIEYK